MKFNIFGIVIGFFITLPYIAAYCNGAWTFENWAFKDYWVSEELPAFVINQTTGELEISFYTGGFSASRVALALANILKCNVTHLFKDEYASSDSWRRAVWGYYDLRGGNSAHMLVNEPNFTFR